MKLVDVVTAYITLKRAAGMRFRSEVGVLKAFCRTMGDIELTEVSPQSVQAFLVGRGPVTSFWHQKYAVLGGFYRFAISRAYLATSSLPLVVPKRPPPLTPYIYSVAELRRLLEATERLHTPMSPLQATTVRTLLLLLYGSAMRVSEALALTLADVDLDQGLITVRDTKFFKTRWVPIGPKLTTALRAYADRRCRLACPAGDRSAFLVTRTGHPLSYKQANRLFIRVRHYAAIQRAAPARYQPRLHDLRHTAIVHRVVAWHQAERDVGRLLLPLATYVGHADITSTQHYLSMTPELLTAASQRFPTMPTWRCAMKSEVPLLGPWVRRFLLERLVLERNLACNTQRSYRDTLTLLCPFVSTWCKKPIDQLLIDDLSPACVRQFLTHLEHERHCTVATRNQRLGAIHTLARFIALHSPQHLAWCGELRAIPFKKTPTPAVGYLEKPEMEALLQAPNQQTAQGRRDYAILLFLYNTGARATEVAEVQIGALSLQGSPSVRLIGKGDKVRYCPLWATTTVPVLTRIVAGRRAEEAVFLNRSRQPLTRFGIRTLVKRYADKASQQMPSLGTKSVTTHTIRHTTAVHLLRAWVDINTIRAWLGQVSLETTHVYAEIDLEMKAEALAHCEVSGASVTKQWHTEPELMAFLKGL